jgi:adenosyl cobinamide kinase/adenosyl cobinamide phosphate guanylyltransferase
MSSVFILGGVRSGKSRHAIAIQRPDIGVAFVATAVAGGDRDMAARIARHRAERPPHWTTIEEPFDLIAALDRLPPHTWSVIVDCLTLWVANRQLRGDADDEVLDDARRLARLIARGLRVTVVSNEVGAGVHPATADGLRFRDLLGRVNQEIAAACPTVLLMVAGIPLAVKAPPVPPPEPMVTP